MNRNVESKFALNPTINIGRSKMPLHHTHTTTMDFGRLVPIDAVEILPGDTWKQKVTACIRLQTLLNPVFSNAVCDISSFFVPMRLVWSHTKEFFGENTQSAWAQAVDYEIPQIEAPDGGWQAGTLADYFGVPIGVDGIEVSAILGRAYALICNEFYRDQNLTDPLNIPVDDTTQAGSNGDSYINDVVNLGMPFKVAKTHDLFTSCLPGTQKGDAVKIPIASGTGDAPVTGNGYAIPFVYSAADDNTDFYYPIGKYGSAFGMAPLDLGESVGTGHTISANPSNNSSVGLATMEQLGEHPEYSGMVVSAAALGIEAGTINDLRMAFSMQKFLEKMARAGSRYTEIISSCFGVNSPDSRLQRPEYLGGSRFNLNINQVVQTSGTGDAVSTPQGNVSAYSLTIRDDEGFTHSFVEHGYIITVACLRYPHIYQQGIPKLFSRKTKYDFYWPVFQALGEMPIFNKEIYAQGSSVVDEDTGVPYDEEVFGYNEAWAQYRTIPNRISGEMRSQYSASLDSWHWADDYESMPFLSDDWIREDATNIDRTLAVSSRLSQQALCDFYFDVEAVRPMPVVSIPGLIDHF